MNISPSRVWMMKSVSAGLYAAPPAHGPQISEICGTRPGFHGGFHGVGDLVGMHFARRAAGHREILARQMDRPTGDSSTPGSYSIGRQILIAHTEELPVMLGEKTGLLEGIAIQ
jgi:hypothetical protein